MMIFFFQQYIYLSFLFFITYKQQILYMI